MDDSVMYHRSSRCTQIPSGNAGLPFVPCPVFYDIVDGRYPHSIHTCQLSLTKFPVIPVFSDLLSFFHIKNDSSVMDESFLRISIFCISRVIFKVKMFWVATPPASSTFMKHTKRIRVLSGFKKIIDSVGECVFVSFSAGDYPKKAISVLGGISRPRPALIRPILDHVRPENFDLLWRYNRHWLAIFGGHTGVL